MSQLLQTSDGYRYSLDSMGVELEFRTLRRTGGGVYSGVWADIVCTAQQRDVHEARYNLSSSSQRASLVKFLSGRIQLPDDGDDWTGIVEAACIGVLRAWRQGRAPVDLSEGDEPGETIYRVDPILEDGQLTMIYGEKSSGKSELALAISYAVTDDVSLLSLPTVPGPVFYLDWETDEATTKRRLWWLATGLGAPTRPRVHYFEMTRSLPDEAEGIQRRIEKEGGAGLIVIDSLVPACGGNAKEPDAATAFWHSIRAFKATTLCVAQTQKVAPGEKRKGQSVFGSGIFEYAARSIWRIRGNQEPGSNLLDIGLFHEKCNNGTMRPALGWQVTFDKAARTTIFRPQEPKAVAAFSEALPIKDQIGALLKGGGRAMSDIAAELGQKEESVRRTLQRYEGKLFNRSKDGALWGNRSYQDS